MGFRKSSIKSNMKSSNKNNMKIRKVLKIVGK